MPNQTKILSLIRHDAVNGEDARHSTKNGREFKLVKAFCDRRNCSSCQSTIIEGQEIWVDHYGLSAYCTKCVRVVNAKGETQCHK